MTSEEKSIVVKKIKETLIKAGSASSDDKESALCAALSGEANDLSRWAMNTIAENMEVAKKKQSPLCDDTGIPHVIIEIGSNRSLPAGFIDSIFEGISDGLKELPGRPMAIIGNEKERISQTGELDEHSEAVKPAPFMLKESEDSDRLRVTILMQGGGPEIRAKTYRVFHKHSINAVTDEIINWAKESVGQLGCSPCTLAVGIGRSHYEASSLMLQAMQEGNYGVQSHFERQITDRVNEVGVGALGLGGSKTVLATFVKVGPQRASGVRIVCMRPCCCFEPRKASVDF